MSRTGEVDKMHLALNVAAFQVGWFASVLGAAHGLPWIGPLVVVTVLAWHLFWNPRKWAEGILALASAAFGIVFDSALIAGGVFSPVHYWMPPPLSPLWMIFLWINFATIVNVSLRWLHGRHVLSVLFGAIGGPAAYYGGAQLGAAQNDMGWWSILILSAAWSAAVPGLICVAKFIKEYDKT